MWAISYVLFVKRADILDAGEVEEDRLRDLPTAAWRRKSRRDCHSVRCQPVTRSDARTKASTGICPGLIATPFSLLRCARAAMENVAATQSAFQRVRAALS